MRKLFPTVAASLLFIALVILAQAPDGAVPAGKAPGGPDAAVANVVNTVCASCHTLERVNDKKADKDGWTTTVNRMKEKGANLTDEQVPVVVDYLARTAGTFTVTFTAPDGAVKGKGKGKGKGGGKGGDKGGFVAKNLKVLKQGSLADSMQNFVIALGLADKGRCNFCHVEDRSSDEKMEKLTARNMILMVREINARFEDGKQHVTCYTCHRGSTTPVLAP